MIDLNQHKIRHTESDINAHQISIADKAAALSPYLNKPTAVALKDVNIDQLASSGLHTALGALDFCSDRAILSDALGEPGEASAPAEEIIAVACKSIREVAANERPAIFVPDSNPFFGRALKNALDVLGVQDFDLINSINAIKSFNQRRAIIDVSGMMGLETPLGVQRHIGPQPVFHMERLKTGLVEILCHLSRFSSLQQLGIGQNSADNPLQDISVMQCCSAGASQNSSLVFSGQTLKQIAGEQRIESVNANTMSEPATGFMRRYTEQDFRQMLSHRGSQLGVMLHCNKVLGYVVYFLDSSDLPHQAHRMLGALDAKGMLPTGAVGYAKILHVTETGKRYSSLTGISIYDELHDSVIASAKAAGLTSMIAEVRAYPNPNVLAYRIHRRHGWKDSNISLLYPYSEKEYGFEYTLGKILIKKLDGEN